MYHFIINPRSKSGAGLKLWNQVVPELEKRGIEYKTHFTEKRYHATEIVKSLTFDPEIKRTIIVFGGDGTINEVLNGIVNLQNVTLGYIPTGSGNDFARGLGLPTDIKGALNYILEPKYFAKLDVGVIKFNNTERRFGVSCGIGFDAGVCHQVNESSAKDKLNKIKLGKLVYFAIALKQLFSLKLGDATVVVDDNIKYEFHDTYFAAAMNNRFEGGGFKFSPDARPDDGILDFIVADKIGKFKVLTLLPKAMAGKHVGKPGIHNFTGHKADITFTNKSPVHCDGESCFHQTHIEVEVIPKSLNMIMYKPL